MRLHQGEQLSTICIDMASFKFLGGAGGFGFTSTSVSLNLGSIQPYNTALQNDVNKQSWLNYLNAHNQDGSQKSKTQIDQERANGQYLKDLPVNFGKLYDAVEWYKSVGWRWDWYNNTGHTLAIMDKQTFQDRLNDHFSGGVKLNIPPLSEMANSVTNFLKNPWLWAAGGLVLALAIVEQYKPQWLGIKK